MNSQTLCYFILLLCYVCIIDLIFAYLFYRILVLWERLISSCHGVLDTTIFFIILVSFRLILIRNLINFVTQIR